MAESATYTAPEGEGVAAAAAPRTIRDRLSGLGAVRLGSLQVVIGLVVIWTVFGFAHDRFLSPANLTNLALQVASVGIISLGVVMVLLVAQIDLSVGSISGVTTALMVVLNVNQGVSAVLALAGGATIGLLHGLVTTRFKVPALIADPRRPDHLAGNAIVPARSHRVGEHH